MENENEPQRTPGRRQPCCVSLRWAVFLSYIKRGYPWHFQGQPVWVPWTLNLKGNGWAEISPIHFCPFCGTNLDKPEK